jgi:hypothetical protein
MTEAFFNLGAAVFAFPEEDIPVYLTTPSLAR